jgi:D-aspartate ligase
MTDGAVVISEHIRGLAVIRSLARRGIRVWNLAAPGELLGQVSRYTSRTLSWPSGDDEHRLEYLLSLAATHRLDGWTLFVSNDETAAFCARHHAMLRRHFRLTMPAWDVMRWAYDKRLTHQAAASAGIDQPVTFFPRTRDELLKLPLTFPVVLKPAFKKHINRFTNDKAWRADDRQALAARYDEACALVDPDVIIVQELIPGAGDTQFSFAALCDNGNCLATVGARRTRQYPIDFGHSSSFVETMDHPVVEQAARRLLAAIGWTGLAEVEFKYDTRDGRCKLLEINPRVWTWHALCRRAGVDFPYLLWKAAHGEAIEGCRGRSGVAWARMSTDLAAAFGEMRRGRLGIRQYLDSLRQPIEFATFAIDDPIPGLLDLLVSLGARLRRARTTDGPSLSLETVDIKVQS